MTLPTRVAASAVAVAAVILIGFCYSNDHLPPDNPVKATRRITGLDIPRTTRVRDYEHSEGGPGGFEVSLKASLQLDSAAFAELARAARAKGYRPLPLDSALDAIASQHLSQQRVSQGLYWYRKHSTGGAELFILDERAQQLLVKYSSM